jgi:hypothetical protein
MIFTKFGYCIQLFKFTKIGTFYAVIPFSQKERWMPNLRQQKENRVAFDACVNKTRRSAVWADLTKQITSSYM